MKSSVILLGAVMSFIKPCALQRCPVVWAGPRRRLPWLQFSSSLWSMQSKMSSQRQRRGMQCARFRQRNSSSWHSFTQPICQDRKQQVSKLFTLSLRRGPNILWCLTGYLATVSLEKECYDEWSWQSGGAGRRPHPSRRGSCHVRHIADWLTRSPRWRTHTRWQNMLGELEKRHESVSWQISTFTEFWRYV